MVANRPCRKVSSRMACTSGVALGGRIASDVMLGGVMGLSVSSWRPSVGRERLGRWRGDAGKPDHLNLLLAHAGARTDIAPTVLASVRSFRSNVRNASHSRDFARWSASAKSIPFDVQAKA